jgi:nucleotide-binding universal stress UspA family protein
MQLSNIQIQKILYATDLSATAVHAFSYAVSLANKYGASITILHVLAEFPSESCITNMIPSSTWKKIKEENYSQARDALIGKRKGRTALRNVLQVFSEKAQEDVENQDFSTDEILIESGVPADIIVQTAQKNNYDMIVMGTHGQSVLSDVLIGSTAKRVLKQSVIPVLIIRLPGYEKHP